MREQDCYGGNPHRYARTLARWTPALTRLWRHGIGNSLIGEPRHFPAVGLSYTFDGTALDLDAHAVAGLLGVNRSVRVGSYTPRTE
jgi:hypothetical protein